jgi:hypothetical protein
MTKKNTMNKEKEKDKRTRMKKMKKMKKMVKNERKEENKARMNLLTGRGGRADSSKLLHLAQVRSNHVL